MLSERRLHPLSILFNLGKQVAALVLPLAVVIAGRGTDEDRWSVYALVVLIPYGGFVVASYLSFRYRYEASELVIRRGIIFRSQRHVPYDRIQNIDAVQNILHRLTGVVDVKVQTGGGSEPEATLSVLSLADLDEMRRRVFGNATAGNAGPADAGPAPRTLLHLPRRELVLYALIENRGFVVIAAALGLLSEFRFASNFLGNLIDEQVGRGVFRSAARLVFVDGGPSLRVVFYGALALLAFLLLSRLFSIVWAQVRLQGYAVTQVGEDLRTEYGLFTRVTATIPLRRIQAVTIRDTPLHRLLGRASVSVATAGGGAAQNDKAPQHREWIAPIIRRDELPSFLAALFPGTDLTGFDWRPAHPRAFRRMLMRAAMGQSVLVALAVIVFGVRGLWLVPVLGLWSVVHARKSAAYLAWATTLDVVAVRRGAFVRTQSIAPLTKIQVVERHESPFDRRTEMARLTADTAGGRGKIDVPYLPVDTAATLYGQLSAAAAHTEFRW